MLRKINGFGVPLYMGLLVFALIVSLLAVPAGAGEFKGKVETVNDVKIVKNPAEPMEPPKTVDMEMLWELGGDTDDEDQFFGIIADIEIDDQGNVYLLDAQLSEIKIFSDDGEYLRSIGREGEGPGEFRRAGALFFTKDGNIGVLQTFPGKIVVLTPEGEPLADYPLPVPEDGGFQILTQAQANNGQVVLGMARTNFDQGAGKWSRTDFLARVDSDGNQMAEYSSKAKTINMADAVLNFSDWDTFERRWVVTPDGKVYSCESYPDYEITVWNADGSIDKKITREYKHVAHDAEEKEFLTKMMEHFAQTIPGCRVEIEDNAKDIETIHVRDDGSIWVMTASGGRNHPDGSLGTFDVYNKEGQFVKNVTLMGDGDPLDDAYMFVKDRVYVVTDLFQAIMVAQGATGLYDDEEEAEPMAVRCYKLEGDLLSAR
jgi:hypothetical protein